MTDKQEEIGKNAEVAREQQAAAATTSEPKIPESKASELKSADENPATASQSSQKEAAKEPEKEITPASAKSESKMSKGEKWYNRITYTGLNYWVNLGLSVVMADIAINGKGIWRKGLDYSINRTTKHLSSAIISMSKNPDKSKIIRKVHNNTRVGYESLSLLTGGSVLLFPLKFLEDNKRKVVHWLNEKLGVDQTAPDGHKETPEEIHIEKEQPKQSVGNLLWRRLVGTVAVVSSGIIINQIFKNKNKIIPAKTYDISWTKVKYDPRPQGGKENIEEKVFGLLNKARGKEFEPNGIFTRLTKLAILDSMFTGITAAVMWMTSGAKKGKMPKEIDDSNDPPVLKDEVNKITTAADVTERAFADRVENRVNRLVEAKSNGSKKGFVETLQHQELAPAGVGV